MARVLLGGAALLVALAFYLLLRGSPDRGSAGERVSPVPVAAANEAWLAPARAPEAAIEVDADPARVPDARAPLFAEEPPHAVLGTVVDPDGAPVAGASVTLFDAPLHGPRATRPAAELRTATTDAAGRFRFGVASGDALLAVRASAPGFATASRNQSPGVDVPLELARAARLSGRVLGEDAGSARVLAPAVPPQLGWRRLDDGAGRYALGDVEVGASVRLHVIPRDAMPFDEEVAIESRGENAHDIELGERRTLTGLVVDSVARRPAPGVRILALDDEVLAVTDGLGRFALGLQGAPARVSPVSTRERDLLGGQGFLVLGGGEFLRSGVALSVVARGEPLEVVPAGRVEGRVLTAAGEPAVGAGVRWSSPLAVLDPRLGPLRPGGPLETRTDADGRFVLDGLPWGAGAAELVVAHGGSEHWVLDETPEDPAAPRVLELRLPRGRALTGRVTWDATFLEASASVPGARRPGPRVPAPRVTVRTSTTDGAEVARAATDALGVFRLDDLPADTLFVTVDGHPDARRRVAPDSSEPLRIGLVPPFRAFDVVLRSPLGAPLVRHDAWVALERSQGGVWTLGGRTDERGAITVRVPDFESLEPVLVTKQGFVGLERALVEPSFEWTLPELVPVHLELDDEPELPRLVAWTGPGALEGGRTERIERPVGGVLQLELPAGELELRLTCVEPEPRRVTRKSVRVERGAAGPRRISLAR